MSQQTLTDYISNYNNPNSIASRFRRRRAEHLLSLLEECHLRYGRVKVLDIGGRANYWDIVPDDFFHDMKTSVTLINTESELDAGTVKNSKSNHQYNRW